MKGIKQFLPILDWMPSYKGSYLKGDMAAGLTVGIMLIPQGMAYAMIAGLPPVYGLYASIFPQIVYALFGTSRQLAVGPVAMDSLLVAAGVSTIAVAGTENYIALAILLSLLMGGFQLLLGISRMGFLVNFLSQPVISGFTSAAALIIGFNQLQHLLGVELKRNDTIFQIIGEAIVLHDQINWVCVALGIGGILLIKGTQRLHPGIPGALLAVVLSILSVWSLQLDRWGVAIVKDIPAGLPLFQVPDVSNEWLMDLMPVAITLALIAFLEAISVAKAIQSKHRGEYKLDANQELIGLGMANIVGSFFGAYPTTGGFSRSAVSEQAGAKSNVAAFVAAALIVLTLLFLTPLFYYLPKAILVSVIVVAVFGLIDWKYPRYLFNTSRQDFLMLVATFLVTLVFGIKEGIGVGVAFSLGAVIYQTTRPHIAVLGKLPTSMDYRNVDRFKEVQVREDVLVLRQDGRLYFANINYFLDRVRTEVHKKGKPLKLLVLHGGSLPSVDSTALQLLKELIQELNESGISVFFSGVIGPVRDFFHKTGFSQEIGENHFFLHVQQAVDYLDGKGQKHSTQLQKHALQTGIAERT